MKFLNAFGATVVACYVSIAFASNNAGLVVDLGYVKYLGFHNATSEFVHLSIVQDLIDVVTNPSTSA